MPKAGPTKLSLSKDDKIDSRPDLNENGRVEGTDQVTCYDAMDGPGGKFAVPTMKELNMKPATSPHRGGETRALEALGNYMADKKKTAIFEKPKTNPGSFLPPRRRCYHHIYTSDHYRYESSIGTSWTSSRPMDLVPRTTHFARRTTPLPRHTKAASFKDPAPDPEAEEFLQRWKDGTTGFPWIDAIMRQLKRDGWIHHLARHSVACFLTRGHLYIDWVKGAQHFEEHLIDHEEACNVGNWQWLSCTAFFHQYYRVYSPSRSARNGTNKVD
ncbi:hypothetical protein MRB53_040820 [Persea americana]|nr:hypothetical protein MRB53_040820 [Persea americana]